MKLLLLFVLLVLHCQTQIMCFGDSWTTGFGVLQETIQKRHPNINFHFRGLPGSRAEQFAQNKQALPLAVSSAPGTKWVWLTIGGNDLLAGHSRRVPHPETLKRIDGWIRIMLNELYKFHPDIKVSIFGYDLLNFEKDDQCKESARRIFREFSSTFHINHFLKDLGDTIKNVTKSYPNVVYVEGIFGR